MPIFEVTAPDGRKFEIGGPEGSTPEQALEKVQQQAPTDDGQGGLRWGDVPFEALRNLPGSAMKFGEDIVRPFTHPVETAENIGALAKGVMQKTRDLSPPSMRGTAPTYPTEAADKMAQYLGERYGTEEGFKKALAADPVGVAADLSTILAGGGAMLPGKVGRAVSTVSRTVDPLSLLLAPAQVAGKVGSAALGVTTGTGVMPIREAFGAGIEGGPRAKAFTENMRGVEPITNVVDEAKQAIGKMRRTRGTEYQAGMQSVKADRAVLSFADIDTALAKAASVGTFQGKVIDKSASGIWDDIYDAVSEWRKAAPDVFHTAEGLDALKRRLGDIQKSAPPNTPSAVVAGRVYNAVKDEIIRQAPQYAKTMKDYEQASTLITDIEKTLSLNPRANVDTSIRKLQSVMRNNVYTTYGRRVDLAEILQDAGAPNLLSKLAGQAMSSEIPRGIQAAGAGATGVTMLATNPSLIPALAATSPRLVGEAAYYAGRAASPFAKAGQLAGGRAGLTRDNLRAAELGSFQAGRSGEGQGTQEPQMLPSVDAWQAIAEALPMRVKTQLSRQLFAGDTESRADAIKMLRRQATVYGFTPSQINRFSALLNVDMAPEAMSQGTQ